MLTLLEETFCALSDYIEAMTGIRPEKRAYKLSRTGWLSLSSFVRSDAEHAAALLRSDLRRCMLWGIGPITDVRAENGWLLFELSPAFFATVCDRAAALGRVPGTDYVSMRMRMLMRKPSCPCPEDPFVYAAVLRSLFADDRGVFTVADDRAILTMTHHERGMQRVALENACGTAARAILMLRAPKARVCEQ